MAQQAAQARERADHERRMVQWNAQQIEDEMRREQARKETEHHQRVLQDEMRRAQDRELEERVAQNVQDETIRAHAREQRQRVAQMKQAECKSDKCRSISRGFNNWRHNGFKMKIRCAENREAAVERQEDERLSQQAEWF